jgi:hypothetical protein
MLDGTVAPHLQRRLAELELRAADAEIAVLERLRAVAEGGELLALEYFSRLDSGQRDLQLLDGAIAQLMRAVEDGIDDRVLVGADVFTLLGDLFLQFTPIEAPDAADAAEFAYVQALDCDDIDQPTKVHALAGIAMAHRDKITWLRSLLVGGDSVEQSVRLQLLPTLNALVDAWENLLGELGPDDDRKPSVITELLLALAEAYLADGHRPGDADALLRLSHSLSHIPSDSDDERRVAIVLIVSQALAIAFEREGRAAFLEAAAAMIGESRTRPIVPSEMAPILDSMLGSVILNAPEGHPLARRLVEAQTLLTGAAETLPPEDPHLPQIRALLAILRRRLGSRDGPVSDFSTAALSDFELTATAEQGIEVDEGVLLSNLAAMVDARFQKRRDLRDARASLAMTEEAIRQTHGGALQRAALLGNRALQLMRISSVDARPGLVEQAVASAREALSAVPHASGRRGDLGVLLAITLLAATEAGRGSVDRKALMDEVRASLAPALLDHTDDVHPQWLAIAISLDAILKKQDGDLEAAAAAMLRLDELRDKVAAADGDASIFDLLISTLVGNTAQADPGTLDAVIARLETARQLKEDDERHPVDGWLVMQLARLLRARDDASWVQAGKEALATPVLAEVNHRQLREWLDRGGSDQSQISDLMIGQAVATIRDRRDRGRSRELGLRALRGHAYRVLLQTGTSDAMVTAQAASSDAQEVAAWCFSDGDHDGAIAALETGRALTLLAASSGPAIAAHLQRHGQVELAAVWHSDYGAKQDNHGRVPEDSRHRVLDWLHNRGDLGGLLSIPDRDEITAALRDLHYDLLVYLIPGRRTTGTGKLQDGGAIVISRSGFVRWVALPDLSMADGGMVMTYLETHNALLDADRQASQRTLEAICEWAWEAAIGPLSSTLEHIHPDRRGRIVLVPVDALCVIPWHAASPAADRTIDPQNRRYAMDLAVFSYSASAALLCMTARRPRPVLDALQDDESVLLIGDPAGDLPFAQAETQALRSAFYTRARLWGQPPEVTDAVGTPAQLRYVLAEAACSLLHYAGHAAIDPEHPGSSALVMGPQRLPAETIMELERSHASGLCVCLAACTTHLTERAFDESLTLSTAFLLAGASTVVGSLWRIKDASTAILMFMVHRGMSQGLPPADALHRAQRWMLNPNRRIPTSMPAQLRDQINQIDCQQVINWAGLVHLGH